MLSITDHDKGQIGATKSFHDHGAYTNVSLRHWSPSILKFRIVCQKMERRNSFQDMHEFFGTAHYGCHCSQNTNKILN